MLLYIIKSVLLLALLYGCFALLLSRETFHRFNRVALLCVLVASLLLPAVQLTMDKPGFLRFWEASSTTTAGVGTISPEEMNALLSEQTAPSLIGRAGGESWESVSQLLSVLYLIGLTVSVGLFLVQLVRFWRETKGGTRTRDEEGNTVVIRGGDFSPYSFFHTIIISASDYEHLRQPILAHEQAHIRLGHSWDLLLLEVVKAVQWFNPFVYLLGRDLKAVHEYEADSAVLQQGIDAKTYQLLLVTKAVGNRLQTLGNNLSHHSLKKRIKMMHKKSSNRWLMTKAVVLPALMALAVVAFATPKTETATLPEGTSIQSELTAPVASNANDDIITGVPEKLPEFPGGVEALYKWLMDNLQYPKECMEQGIQGRVLVHFIVKKDGTITDVQAVRSPHEKLSEEAVRIVKMMPKWTPGKQNGKPVQSEFNLPIFFKLNADQPKSK